MNDEDVEAVKITVERIGFISGFMLSFSIILTACITLLVK